MLAFLFTKIKKPKMIIALIFHASLKAYDIHIPFLIPEMTTYTHIEVLKEWTSECIRANLKEIFIEIVNYETENAKKFHYSNVNHIKNFLNRVEFEKAQNSSVVYGELKNINKSKFYMWECYFHERYIQMKNNRQENPKKSKENIFFEKTSSNDKNITDIDLLAYSFTQIFMTDPKWCLQTCGMIIYSNFSHGKQGKELVHDFNFHIQSGSDKKYSKFSRILTGPINIGTIWCENAMNKIYKINEFMNAHDQKSYEIMLNDITKDLYRLWKDNITNYFKLLNSAMPILIEKHGKLTFDIHFSDDSYEIIVLKELTTTFSNIFMDPTISEIDLAIDIFKKLIFYRNRFVRDFINCCIAIYNKNKTGFLKLPSKKIINEDLSNKDFFLYVTRSFRPNEYISFIPNPNMTQNVAPENNFLNGDTTKQNDDCDKTREATGEELGEESTNSNEQKLVTNIPTGNNTSDGKESHKFDGGESEAGNQEYNPAENVGRENKRGVESSEKIESESSSENILNDEEDEILSQGSKTPDPSKNMGSRTRTTSESIIQTDFQEEIKHEDEQKNGNKVNNGGDTQKANQSSQFNPSIKKLPGDKIKPENLNPKSNQKPAKTGLEKNESFSKPVLGDTSTNSVQGKLNQSPKNNTNPNPDVNIRQGLKIRETIHDSKVGVVNGPEDEFKPGSGHKKTKKSRKLNNKDEKEIGKIEQTSFGTNVDSSDKETKLEEIQEETFERQGGNEQSKPGIDAKSQVVKTDSTKKKKQKKRQKKLKEKTEEFCKTDEKEQGALPQKITRPNGRRRKKLAERKKYLKIGEEYQKNKTKQNQNSENDPVESSTSTVLTQNIVNKGMEEYKREQGALTNSLEPHEDDLTIQTTEDEKALNNPETGKRNQTDVHQTTCTGNVDSVTNTELLRMIKVLNSFKVVTEKLSEAEIVRLYAIFNPFKQLSRGAQARINNRIADLVHQLKIINQ